jgi:mono/diheme cytochrome c family protein
MSQSTETDEVEDKLYGLLAEYESPGALIEAAKKVRKAGYTKFDCHSPFPVHGIDPAMGIKPTILPMLTFGAGIAGTALALLMQTWMNNWAYPWNVGGKPLISLPMQIPIAFEVTVLLAAFATFFGMWGLNKLPQVWHPLFTSDNFMKASCHGFFVAIEAEDPKFDEEATKITLEEAGATEVEAVRYKTSKSLRALPKGVIAFMLISTSLALVPFAYIYKQRVSKSDQPHYHVNPNMDFQEKNKPQTASDVFPDGRAGQLPVANTVARGELKADDHFYRGLTTGRPLVNAGAQPLGAPAASWATAFPKEFEFTSENMDRGQERYGIYCSPCHGLTGDGTGMVNQRADKIGATATGWVAPSNITQSSFARQPHGQLFNTITHGIRTMPGYGTQIKEFDRWAIVFYLRALQRSAHSRVDDVPAGELPAIR